MLKINDAASLGEAIRRERKRQGLTQGQLAEYCDVGVNFVSNVERGKETAEIGKVLALLEKLGIVLCVGGRSEWRRISRYTELDAESRFL